MASGPPVEPPRERMRLKCGHEENVAPGLSPATAICSQCRQKSLLSQFPAPARKSWLGELDFEHRLGRRQAQRLDVRGAQAVTAGDLSCISRKGMVEMPAHFEAAQSGAIAVRQVEFSKVFQVGHLLQCGKVATPLAIRCCFLIVERAPVWRSFAIPALNRR